MVDDLQTLAAADAASLRLQRRRTDLAIVAASAADSLARRFEAADVALHRQLSGLRSSAPRWLHQVATNLLSNALKFTQAAQRHHCRQPRWPGRRAGGHRYRHRHPRR